MKIQFNGTPFVLDVLETQPCEPDAAHSEPHDRHRVIDPEGEEDWVCAHDVTVIAV